MKLYDGKYEVRQINGLIQTKRNGEEWKVMNDSLVGNGFVLDIIQELEEKEKIIRNLKIELEGEIK